MAKKGASDAGELTAEGGAQAGAKKSGGGIVGLAILAVGAMTSSFATVYVLASDPRSAAVACTPADATAGAEPIAKEDQAYVELRDILITIGSEPATRYLKMKIAVVTDSAGAGMVSKAEPVLIDAFTNYLRSVELSDFENPDFYAHMREQLGRRSQLVLGSDVSDGVLITEFLLR
jgi:flagellar FliL protein